MCFLEELQIDAKQNQIWEIFERTTDMKSGNMPLSFANKIIVICSPSFDVYWIAAFPVFANN